MVPAYHQDMRQDIMSRISERLRLATAKHNKVLFTRMDVRFPNDFGEAMNNHLISELLRLLKEYYTYHGIDFHYVWVREQADAHHPHYHMVLLLDGTRLQSPYGIFDRARHIWAKLLGLVNAEGLIDHCMHEFDGMPAKNGFLIRRPSSVASAQEQFHQQEEFNNDVQYALYRSAYLAKTYSKGFQPGHAKEFSCSQIKAEERLYVQN